MSETLNLFAENPEPAPRRSTMDFRTEVARRKLGAGQDWEPCRWEALGHGAEADCLITGGVPVIRNGKRKWPPITKCERVCVTHAEYIAERKRFEAETGKCSNCDGTGQEWAGWSASDGNRYRDCRHCHATGRAVEENS